VSRHNDPSMPCAGQDADELPSRGLTIREHFAGLAMQGLCANSHDTLAAADGDRIAAYAVAQADALIAELAKE
jgi:hypothetical protein